MHAKSLQHWYGIGVIALSCMSSLADSESRNWAFVTAAITDGTTWRGGYYAKCIPSGMFGTNGITKIYRVEKEQDILVHTYQWYTPQIYLSGASGKISVVRFGEWRQGSRANAKDLALAFYYDGKLLKSYSTLDICGKPDNVIMSVSHYMWHKTIIGYGWMVPPGSKYLMWGFSLQTIDGRTLYFDVQTGQLIKNAKPAS